MTLTARVMIGTDPEVEFPRPARKVRPRTLAKAAQHLLDENYTVDRKEIYPRIGFDSAAALRHLKALAKENHDAGDEPETDYVKSVKEFRVVAKAVGLELIAGLFLSVLDSPGKTLCPCRTFIKEGRAIPYYAAPQGNPDVHAEYGEYVILAEVTSIFSLRKEDIDTQWDGAKNHVEAETGRPRIYCFMVSRLGLDGYDGRDARRTWQRAKLAEAQEDRETLKRQAALNGDPEPPDVKFLVFNIEEMAEIAKRLDNLYCGQGPKRKALTEEALGRILDRLHAMAMERIAAGEDFAADWAGSTFNRMLYNHAIGHPLEGKPPKDTAAA